MSNSIEIYRYLQEHLDKLPIGFPSTESGVEIRILKRLFTPVEAEIALKMNFEYESAEVIQSRIERHNLTLEKVNDLLTNMAKKGAITTSRMGDTTNYSLNVWIIGMYEYQVNKLSKDFIQDVSQYSNEAFSKEFATSAAKTSQFRVIPVEKSITYKSEIATYDQLRAVIENVSPIAVANCICRQRKDLEGQPCRSDLREVCMPFGSFAQHYIDHNIGRAIDKDEAMNLVCVAEKEGFVIQAGNSQSPGFFCLCCGDCCGVLTGMKTLPRPIDFCSTNFHAEVDQELCTGCEICLDRCQIDALTIIDGVSNVNRDRCLGCGLCVSTCPEDAIHLSPNETIYTPPSDWKALYEMIASNKTK